MRLLPTIILLTPLVTLCHAEILVFKFNPKLTSTNRTNDGVKVSPNVAVNLSSGFTICLRFLCHFWTVAEIVTSESFGIAIANYTTPYSSFKLSDMWFIAEWPGN